LRILLDTHVLLWAIDRPRLLDAATRAQLENPGNEVLFSSASIWEIAIKAGLKRADFQAEPEKVAEAARATGFSELPITAAVAATVADLPPHHRDPFDRLLIAQAIALPARFYTVDLALPLYSELVTLIPAG
jgi:PIN domain nuclease of toxin-antitoxin system